MPTFAKCSCLSCGETIHFQQKMHGVSIACPFCAHATKLPAATNSRPKPPVFTDEDLDQLRTPYPASNQQKLELRFWNRLDLLEKGHFEINSWRDFFYEEDARRALVWTYHQKSAHIDPAVTEPERIPVGEGEHQFCRFFGKEARPKAHFVFKCVGSLPYLTSVHCLVEGVEVTFEPEARRVWVIHHPRLPLMYHGIRNNVNYCGFEIAEGLYYHYQRTLKLKPEVVERKWFGNEAGKLKLFPFAANAGFSLDAFKQLFLREYQATHSIVQV